VGPSSTSLLGLPAAESPFADQRPPVARRSGWGGDTLESNRMLQAKAVEAWHQLIPCLLFMRSKHRSVPCDPKAQYNAARQGA
jgi:hypothetical protein